MSLQFSLNNLPSTGSIAMYTLMHHLVTQGWTVPSSSDGTTYNSSGNQITGGGTGANGLGNNNAWFRVKMPSASREWCIQRGTTDLVWRIKYSVLGFSGGSPSATQTPSAVDEQVIVGSGTNASPTFQGYYGNNGTFRYHIAADNAAPYGFWAFAIPSGGNCNSLFIYDPMASGSYESNDAEPYVMFLGSQLFMIDTTKSGSSGFWGFGTVGGGNESPFAFHNGSFVGMAGNCWYFGGGSAPGGTTVPANPVTSSDDALPCYYGRPQVTSLSQPWGYKGRSSLINYTTVARSNLDISSDKKKIVFGYLFLDWDGATTPLT